MFIKNYLYELPDDIQFAIYKNVFASCIVDIENKKDIKYLNRLYRATNNPKNTCVYSIKPKGMFCSDSGDSGDYCGKYYKYKRIADLEDVCNRGVKSLIYLDRSHLIEDTSHSQSNIISIYMYPLFTSSRNLRKYLAIRFNLVRYYDKKMIKTITVVDDRIDVVFTRYFECNADIYYNIMVAYNVLYNSLSNIIYSEENTVMFNKFIELFRWLEMNNVLEGYNMYDDNNNNKVIPMFEATHRKK